ncbi:hypothetical protein PO002_38110 [Cupriavidus necator]|uniref:hypothetical protein n=1 Tax=Cupriavidus necator TaxID=106590 RepID=UPI0039C1AEBF
MNKSYQHSRVVKDAYGVRAILPRPEGRGLTRLPIKVTFTGTTGEETTGKAQYDHASGLVTLPTSFLTLIEQAKAVGIGYALVAHEDGYQFPLLHDGGATYRMDRSRRARRTCWFWHGRQWLSQLKSNDSSRVVSLTRCRQPR